MSTTNPKDYYTSITTQTTSREALDKISRVSEWWGTNLEGESQNIDDVFTVRFGETFVTFKIVEFVPEKRAVWQVTDCYLGWLNDKTEWKGTKIDWQVSSHGKTTHIDMTHIGLIPGIECYNDCKIGWDNNIRKSLLKFLTENRGEPDTY